MQQLKIRFHTARNFGETFNVSIDFIRQNFTLFFQSVLLMASPFMVLSAICFAYYQWDKQVQLQHLTRLSQFYSITPGYAAYLLSAAVANLVLMGVIYSFILTYAEKGPGNFTLRDVSQRLRERIGGLITMFLLFGVLIIITLGFTAGSIYVLKDGAPVLAALLIFALAIALLLVLPPLFWQYSMAFFVKMQDNDLPFDAYGRTRYAMQGNYWWTWLIVVCGLICVSIASLSFGTPLIIFSLAMRSLDMSTDSTFYSTGFYILTFLSSFFSSLMYSVLYTICVFHFYSLIEKKEGTGLLERIDEIGQTPVNTNYHVEQQY